MEEYKEVAEWKKHVGLVLTSKRNEFRIFGYDKATEEDIWKCMLKLIWKQKNPSMRLYEVVADVMQLKITSYMTYLTMDMYMEDDDLMASISALRGD